MRFLYETAWQKRRLGDIVAVDRHRAARRLQERDQDLDSRRFAGAVGTEEAKELALPDGEGNPAHRLGAVGIHLPEVLDFDNAGHARSAEG
jgi:hypothetical protein